METADNVWDFEKSEKDKNLQEQRNEIVEKIMLIHQKKQDLKNEQRKIKEKNENKHFELFDEVETLLASGIGATAGMIIAGAFQRNNNAVTPEMAYGGIAGALIGASAPIISFFLQKKLWERKVRNLQKRINELEDDLQMAGEIRQNLTNEMQQSKSKAERKAERKQYVQELKR